MKRRVLKCMVALMLILSMIAGYSVSVSAADMAYNIYSEPKLDGENQFDTYTIDFLSTKTPYYTYWALANFSMYISEQTQNRYRGIRGGGGYAGLQDRGEGEGRGHSAIMSFWEWRYGNNVLLEAERIYPYGDPSHFGGEGEGTNWITPYDWKDNQWYRMVLHTWNDTQTGTTFMGQWFQDLTTGEWTLISYFDTKMVNSCISGNLHFFMENYVGSTSGEERDVQLKNMYVQLHDDKSWVSLTTTKFSHCNNVSNNKTGAHSFGAAQEFFWAKSGGAVPDGQTQAQHNAAWPTQSFTISQPEQPTFGTPVLDSITLAQNEEGVWTANWEMDSTGTPQLTYSVDVKDVDGNRLFSKSASRPEIVSQVLEGVTTDAFICNVIVTDVFGKTATLSVSTDKYKELVPEEEEKDPEPTTEPTQPSQPVENDKPESDNTGLIIGVSVAAVVVIGGVAGAVLVLKKKKK